MCRDCERIKDLRQNQVARTAINHQMDAEKSSETRRVEVCAYPINRSGNKERVSITNHLQSGAIDPALSPQIHLESAVAYLDVLVPCAPDRRLTVFLVPPQVPLDLKERPTT